MASPIIPQTKCCKKCGQTLPATLEYFYHKANGLYGLYSRCKKCHRAMTSVTSKAWNKAHPERVKAAQRRWIDRDPETTREKRTNWARTWRKNNPDKARAAWQRQKIKRKKEGYKYSRTAAAARPATRLTRRVRNQKYKARKRNLPNSLTSSEWVSAVNYFNGCCAVCGRQLSDLFATHSVGMDHWIPLTDPDCPGTIAANIIPLCHGEGGCNNLKGAKRPDEWLVSRYGSRKAKQVLNRIETYFDWVKSSEKDAS